MGSKLTTVFNFIKLNFKKSPYDYLYFIHIENPLKNWKNVNFITFRSEYFQKDTFKVVKFFDPENLGLFKKNFQIYMQSYGEFFKFK